MRKPLLSLMAMFLASCGSTDGPSVVIQAENFNRGTVTIDKGEHGYGQGIGVILTFKPSAFAEYDIEIPKSTNYSVEIRCASAGPRPVRVLVDGQLVTEHGAEGTTGGFLPEHQKWLEGGVVSLTRGKHMLRLESDGVFPHIDQLRLSATSKAVTTKS